MLPVVMNSKFINLFRWY